MGAAETIIIKKVVHISDQKKKQKYDQRLETVIYLCMQLKCGREKNSEANTLAMLFEAHRSLLIDFFVATKTAKNADNGPHVHIPINNETQNLLLLASI